MEVSVAICCQVHLYAEGICKLLEDDDETRPKKKKERLKALFLLAVFLNY